MKRSFITCILHQILLGYLVKEDKVGMACSTHKRDKKCIHNFGWKT